MTTLNLEHADIIVHFNLWPRKISEYDNFWLMDVLYAIRMSNKTKNGPQNLVSQ